MTDTELAPIKEADVDPRVHEILRRRWSPRAFQSKAVDRDLLLLMFEAARWAASCANEQPCRFIVATKDDPAAFERVLGCLVEGNQAWARNAPVLMITAAKTTFGQSGGANRHAWHDVGLATGNLFAQATALGLAMHVMGGFDSQKAREALLIPDGFEPVTAIAVGYKGHPGLLPEALRAREIAPRTRKPLGELVFNGRWPAGEPNTP